MQKSTPKQQLVQQWLEVAEESLRAFPDRVWGKNARLEAKDAEAADDYMAGAVKVPISGVVIVKTLGVFPRGARHVTGMAVLREADNGIAIKLQNSLDLHMPKGGFAGNGFVTGNGSPTEAQKTEMKRQLTQTVSLFRHEPVLQHETIADAVRALANTVKHSWFGGPKV